MVTLNIQTQIGSNLIKIAKNGIIIVYRLKGKVNESLWRKAKGLKVKNSG